MPSLTPRENYLRALRHEETEFVPFQDFFATGSDTVMVGLFSPTDMGQQANGGKDGYGVRWSASEAALGGAIPEPGNFILKDVTQWKKQVTIPDVKKIDYQNLAAMEEKAFNIDREKQAVLFIANCGPWERLAALMGFEEAMIAMLEEPEAVSELLTAITDHKIALAEVAARCYHADAFMNFDDIATERQLFMSPETYRSLIKPQHTRLNRAIANFGMIPIQHTCGHAEICVEDYIETGAAGWNALQPTNDIAGLLDKYGDRFVFEGGFDSTGKPGRPGATVEEVEAEVERCFRDYGGKKGFVFAGVVVPSKGYEELAQAQTEAIRRTANRLRFAGK